MPVYNKLIRDRIPEIIEQDGKIYRTKNLTAEEFKTSLLEKLAEEFEELKTAPTDDEAHQELADILEIIHSLATEFGANMNTIEQIRQEKKEKRGGFEKKLFLIDVED